MTRWAMCWVRGPSSRAGRILVQGSMASQRKTHLFGTAEAGAQFVQLEMREVGAEEEPLVQDLCVLTSTSQPGGDGGLTVAEDAFGGGRIQSFGQRREHHCDLL